MKEIFFKRGYVDGLYNDYDFSKLPNVIVEHCNAHKNENSKVESFTAWALLNELLNEVTGVGLSGYEVSFSSRGKPLLNGYYVSISHSNGVVVVGCSSVDFGLDVEVCENVEKYKEVAKKLNVGLNNDLFLKWTEVESQAKLKDKYSVKIDKNVRFNSFYLAINGKKTAISVASYEEFELIENKN